MFFELLPAIDERHSLLHYENITAIPQSPAGPAIARARYQKRSIAAI
jgi:hypothetical protein